MTLIEALIAIALTTLVIGGLVWRETGNPLIGPYA
jgi:hypothetical protein